MAQDAAYEEQKITNSAFPVIFHTDCLAPDASVYLHWHESVELLYFLEGGAAVSVNGVPFFAAAGKLAYVNSGCVHQITGGPAGARYHCLIVGKALLEPFGVFENDLGMENIIQKPEIGKLFEQIALDFSQRPPYYKASVGANVALLFCLLCRGHFRPAAPQVPAGGQQQN